MEILKNYNLKKFNTFGISVNAKYFTILENETDISYVFNTLEFKENKKLFLGGGSNILFTKDFDGIVILNKLQGIQILKEDEECVLLKVSSGENWHNTVLFAVAHDYWGIENLSLVPGTVGATPIQNIGAYGIEIKDTLDHLEAYEIQTAEKRIFLNEECDFGYRNSVFKNKLKDQFFISAVTLKLSKIPKPNVSYKILKNYLEEKNIPLSLKNISDAIIAIRQSKLPDPKIIGNAGSFFKNVFVDKNEMVRLKNTYKDMPIFEDEDGIFKIPAGWLIEQCGLRGKIVGNVGTHKDQALVVVNHGDATGQEIKDFAFFVIASVKDKFGLILEPEVNII